MLRKTSSFSMEKILESNNLDLIKDHLVNQAKRVEELEFKIKKLTAENEQVLYDHLQTKKELDEKILNTKSQLRRVSLTYHNQEEEIQKLQKQIAQEKSKVKESSSVLERASVISHKVILQY